MNLLNQGFDHVEFVVDDLAAQKALYERMGFTQTGARKLPHRGTESILMAQGYVRILLTKGDGSAQSEKNEAVIFRKNHAEGVCVLALEVDDAAAAYQEVMARGARSAAAPEVFETPEGQVVRAEIWTPADVRYRLISRKSPAGENAPALFDEGLVVSALKAPSPNGIYRIDHLTNNVSMGEMKNWVAYYQQIFGFHVSRHFDIRTGRTGLTSDVIESPCRRVKVPINEATEAQSQVQEFVDRMKGAGVQHLALETTGLIDTLKALRSQSFQFLTVPHTYYEVVPTRVPGVTEDLGELEELGILLDGEGEGYLLQIFSQEILGPFFFEYIQRKGNQGFGEGNFRALFEAIERDQIRRGVLKA